MSRYRLLPTPAQQAVLRDHCGHARYVWNLAVEQHAHWRPGWPAAPGYLEQCRQLTQARATYPWLAAGSQTVQQQALRDFAQAMTAFFDPGNPAGRPSWRKAGRHEGFRIVGRGRQWAVRRLSRHVGEVLIPKVGMGAVPMVPRRPRGRQVLPGHAGPLGTLACRVRCLWPAPTVDPPPGTGEVVGVDRGLEGNRLPCLPVSFCTVLGCGSRSVFAFASAFTAETEPR